MKLRKCGRGATFTVSGRLRNNPIGLTIVKFLHSTILALFSSVPGHLRCEARKAGQRMLDGGGPKLYLRDARASVSSNTS
ncbi:MAG: hypothetical protein U0987_00975 [Afipia sp.]|nr:hypothetical protein [Afipia sp.]